MTRRKRVVVIGGGITGTLCARSLAIAGFEVDLLEAHHLGNGSSSRTAAGIRQQFSTPDTVRAMRHCVAFYRQFHDEAGAPSMDAQGYLFLHDDEARLHTATGVVKMQQDAGLSEVEALDAAALKRRFPWVDTETIVGATWCPTDGFLHPQIVYNEAARQARAAGARIHQKAPVFDHEAQGDRLVAVRTDTDRFEADFFVDATNAWAPRTARYLGATVVPVDPLKRYLWFLNRPDSFAAADLRRMPLVIAPTGAYCRPEHDQSLLFGKKYDVPALIDFSSEDQDTVEVEFAHNAGTDAVPYEVWMELATAIPTLAEFEGVTASTAGFYGTTPDHNPFIDFDPLRTNLVRAVGFSGHGAMMGPFTAAAVTALCTAGAPLSTVSLPEGTVSMGAFSMVRSFAHAETMVI